MGSDTPSRLPETVGGACDGAVMTTNDYCPTCREEREFEQPPCVDGHDDCPERACVVCGYALFAGIIPDRPVRRARHLAA
jgi:hypothetical protein